MVELMEESGSDRRLLGTVLQIIKSDNLTFIPVDEI